MKKCRYCGTPQSDERHTCVDCGRPLGKSLSAEEAEAIEDALDDQLDAMSDRTDAFYVSRTDKIFGCLGILGLIAAVILTAISGTELNHIYDARDAALIDAIQSGNPFGEATARFSPTRASVLDQCVYGALIAIVFFIFSVPSLLFPKFIWFLDTIGVRLKYDFDPSPSAFAEASMKLSKYIGITIGCIALAYAAWMYF